MISHPVVVLCFYAGPLVLLIYLARWAVIELSVMVQLIVADDELQQGEDQDDVLCKIASIVTA